LPVHAKTVAADPWRALQWAHPWYAPWRNIGEQVECQLALGLPLWDALNHVGGAPVRFVPHDQLPPALAYERFITDTGTCPTRPGLHDFFNGLCWIQFPETKKKLNQLQAQCIASDGIRPVRGALRDALTLFDENAAFLEAPQPLWDALVAKQWHLLFGSLRHLWGEARLVLFGHALLEKLQTPRKMVTAHVYRVLPDQVSRDDMDAWIAADLNGEQLAKKPFAPLPVLGVPGWWPANSDPSFYDDPAVFRPPRLGLTNNRNSRVHTGRNS
jgi:hypothetical protein